MGSAAIEHLSADPHLGPLVEEHGELTLDRAENSFKRFIVSIINQQLSSASADAIRERVFTRFQITPNGLLQAGEGELRDAGLSRQKIRYIKNIAKAYQENDYGYEYFTGVRDEDVIEELTTIPGVGVWTAKMYLIFCLGRQDVFPVEDLGIRRGMKSLYNEDLTRDQMTSKAEPWRPYRSYASLYIWRIHD